MRKMQPVTLSIEISLALCLILASCAEKAMSNKGKADSDSSRLTVLCYNIHHANPPSKPDFIDLNAIAKVIQESGADLVALQEVDVHTVRSGKSSNQAEELGKITGMEVFFSKGIDFQGGEYGTAILSKFPILDSKRHELPNLEGVNSEPRTLAVVTVDFHGEKIKFANTHLDFSNKENNLHQVQTIAEILKDEQLPIIMAGDFNAVPESPSIQHLDKKFTRSCEQDCPFTSPQQYPKRTIDYIMASKGSGFEVETHRVIEEVYASDHRPVLAVYRFSE